MLPKVNLPYDQSKNDLQEYLLCLKGGRWYS